MKSAPTKKQNKKLPVAKTAVAIKRKGRPAKKFAKAPPPKKSLKGPTPTGGKTIPKNLITPSSSSKKRKTTSQYDLGNESEEKEEEEEAEEEEEEESAEERDEESEVEDGGQNGAVFDDDEEEEEEGLENLSHFPAKRKFVDNYGQGIAVSSSGQGSGISDSDASHFGDAGSELEDMVESTTNGGISSESDIEPADVRPSVLGKSPGGGKKRPGRRIMDVQRDDTFQEAPRTPPTLDASHRPLNRITIADLQSITINRVMFDLWSVKNLNLVGFYIKVALLKSKFVTYEVRRA